MARREAPWERSTNLCVADALKQLSTMLNYDFCFWRRVRESEKVRVYTSLTTTSDDLARFVEVTRGPNDFYVVRAFLFVTNPRATGRDRVHCCLVLNGNLEYHFTCRLKVVDPGLEELYFLTFKEAETSKCQLRPDPTRERLPESTIVEPTSRRYLEAAEPCLPKSEVTIEIAPGVWWCSENFCFYVLELRPDLRPFCPAFYERFFLNNVLAQAVDRRGINSQRAFPPRHVDAVNQTRLDDGESDVCFCRQPCLMQKAGFRDLEVKNDRALLAVLFEQKDVSRLHIKSCARITPSASDVFCGLDSKNCPVAPENGNWTLMRVQSFASMAAICGCYDLKAKLGLAVKISQRHR
ncbi:F-UL16 protein [Chelonid alphaherpesvirus 5]|uniref:F-UL16 protein n=1 Tax=Chelonid alphaherpesvirus 5 TaxID=702736 RepID=V5NWI6_9ALPH|nr:F-UL16 protein [Chelonid alphaherpesvirus 5]AHA93336.1 F-UL16 protein [Chelonid alphaherpesvirus 5]